MHHAARGSHVVCSCPLELFLALSPFAAAAVNQSVPTVAIQPSEELQAFWVCWLVNPISAVYAALAIPSSQLPYSVPLF